MTCRSDDGDTGSRCPICGSAPDLQTSYPATSEIIVQMSVAGYAGIIGGRVISKRDTGQNGIKTISNRGTQRRAGTMEDGASEHAPGSSDWDR